MAWVKSLRILEAAGHDLGGAGAARVDQHDHGQVNALAAAAGVILVIRGWAAALGGDNQLAVGQELFADMLGLIEQAAGVVAQIQDQRLHPLLGQFGQGGVQIVGGFLAELVDADVADAVFAQRKFLFVVDVLDGGNLDDGAHQVEFLGFAGGGAVDGDGNLGARFAAQARPTASSKPIFSVLLSLILMIWSHGRMPAR